MNLRYLTDSFFAYSQIIDTLESFIALLFHQKVNTVMFTEGA